MLNRIGFVQIGQDQWARSAGDSQNASTQTGSFIVFGATAAAESGLKVGKGYSKWALEQLFNGCDPKDNANGIILMKARGCWCGSDDLEYNLTYNHSETRLPIDEKKATAEEFEAMFSSWIAPSPPDPVAIELAEKNAVSAEVYSDMVADIIEQEYDQYREPIQVVDKSDAFGSLRRQIKKICPATGGKVLIAVKDAAVARSLYTRITKLEFNLDIGYFDNIRPSKNKKLNLDANCSNQRAKVAQAYGISIPMAVCHSCIHFDNQDNPCEIRDQRRRALQNQFMILPANVISSLPDGAFQEFDKIIGYEITPRELLFTSRDTPNAGELID